MVRLDKLLADHLNLSRKGVRMLLRRGDVTVNGTVQKSGEQKINPAKESVFVLDEQIHYQEFVYIMMNKPSGVICATTDKSAVTVLDLVPDELQRKGLFPAGRLDKDTVGFVLLTNDGQFAHQMLAPKKHVEKTYTAVLDKPLEGETIGLFEDGLVLDGGQQFQSARLRVLEDKEQPVVEIVICEGKYHQIKRMFQAVGHSVLHLKREKIGSLLLDPALPEGQCRRITKEELRQILLH